jgi:SAM-dependent methyltransferase
MRPVTVQKDDELRDAVREHYAQAARQVSGCCGPQETLDLFGRAGYDDEDATVLPDAALAAALGCGNPTALAELRPGEVVLDLGSGGGIDVLLSARRVAPDGWAFGLDMTPEMLDLARRNQAEAGVTNAEFLLGTIEHVPLPDASVDVIISNCVVNLAVDKAPVFREAYRVLRSGGRLAISDIVLTRSLPAPFDRLVGLWTGCVAGALTETVCRQMLASAGFVDAEIETTRMIGRDDLAEMAAEVDRTDLPAGLDVAAVLDQLDGVVTSAFIRARKP